MEGIPHASGYSKRVLCIHLISTLTREIGGIIIPFLQSGGRVEAHVRTDRARIHIQACWLQNLFPYLLDCVLMHNLLTEPVCYSDVLYVLLSPLPSYVSSQKTKDCAFHRLAAHCFSNEYEGLLSIEEWDCS